jgi:bifunctional non-homologous end joining protein LigD
VQVYVPLNSDVTFTKAKPFARQVAELFERTEPDLIVARQTKSLRPGKVLIDWSQNDQHKTTVCSTRCAPATSRTSRRRWSGTRCAPRLPRATRTTSPSMPSRSSTGCPRGGTHSRPFCL